LQDQE